MSLREGLEKTYPCIRKQVDEAQKGGRQTIGSAYNSDGIDRSP